MTDHITDCRSKYGGYTCELCTTCEHERDDWHQFTFPSGARVEWDDAHADREPIHSDVAGG